jgi:hypothetical protein
MKYQLVGISTEATVVMKSVELGTLETMKETLECFEIYKELRIESINS